MPTSAPETAAITARYQAFAAEARGRSPQYEDLAVAAGRDRPVLAFLATLPPAKQQPNLLFAAARYLLGEPPDLAALHTLITTRRDELTGTMLARTTSAGWSACYGRAKRAVRSGWPPPSARRGATLVIYHSAVLAYVTPQQRGQFAELVRALGAVWLSNEAPEILPGTAADLAGLVLAVLAVAA